jgi:hypothetical protein
MKYKDSAAFRKALETRLRTQSQQSGVPLTRLRKMVAFERFLARLVTDQPGAWVLKGGMALQLRLGRRARTTKDIDLLLKDVPSGDIHQMLVRAALRDLGERKTSARANWPACSAHPLWSWVLTLPI